MLLLTASNVGVGELGREMTICHTYLQQEKKEGGLRF